jgi:drug/metabolite transporter (DMT)-like permease
MKPGDIIFMVLVVAVALLVTVLKNKVPNWLGFILMIAAGLGAIAGGAATKNYKAIPLGTAGALGAIVAWASGATSSAAAADDTLGGVASNIPWWAWLIIAALMVAAIVVTFFIP